MPARRALPVCKRASTSICSATMTASNNFHPRRPTRFSTLHAMQTSAPEKLGHPATVSPAATAKAAVISVQSACRRADLQLGKCIWGQTLMKCVAGGCGNGGVCSDPCTQVHADGAGANACRVYVRGMRGLTFMFSGGTAGSTPTS